MKDNNFLNNDKHREVKAILENSINKKFFDKIPVYLWNFVYYFIISSTLLITLINAKYLAAFACFMLIVVYVVSCYTTILYKEEYIKTNRIDKNESKKIVSKIKAKFKKERFVIDRLNHI